MVFSDLCQDFSRRRPAEPPIGRIPWFQAIWSQGTSSINTLLRHFLRENGYSYLNTLNGDVWFLYQGNWRRCEYEVLAGEMIQFYLLEYIDNLG